MHHDSVSDAILILNTVFRGTASIWVFGAIRGFEAKSDRSVIYQTRPCQNSIPNETAPAVSLIVRLWEGNFGEYCRIERQG